MRIIQMNDDGLVRRERIRKLRVVRRNEREAIYCGCKLRAGP